MLVVISDLHFEEELSRRIDGDDQYESIMPQHNVRLAALTKIVSRLAHQAERDGARKMELVLAGDIFDLHRSTLWFHNNPLNVRPYAADDAATNSALEAKVLEILHRINDPAGTPRQLLQVLQKLHQANVYLDEAGNEREFPIPATLHYLPGNHDRLVNIAPGSRRLVRQLLGLPESEERFANVLTFPSERTIVRHGHEYDRYNYAVDLREAADLPTNLPKAAYDEAPVGDFVTVDIVSRLAQTFRDYHGDSQILSDSLLRHVYQRILDLDNLRPQEALFSYLFRTPYPGTEPEQVWRKIIGPVLAEVLEAIHDHPFLESWLGRLDKPGLDQVDLLQFLLTIRVWKRGKIPVSWLQPISGRAIQAHESAPGPEQLAARETGIHHGDYLFVVAGHTHKPQVSLIGRNGFDEQYYVDTGTWRQQVKASPDFNRFGQVKSLTYAVIYGPNEDLGNKTQGRKTASLDYWSGVTQRWPA